jgi:hypothetical protein
MLNERCEVPRTPNVGRAQELSFRAFRLIFPLETGDMSNPLARNE